MINRLMREKKLLGAQLRDANNLADQWAQRNIALEAECERLRGEISDLHTTMMAAAVEIQEHWAAHCDEEGYGPANLMHRLENGIAAQYGYTAQTIVRLEAERAALSAKLKGANDRARILFDAKNLWAERARKAEAELAAIKGQEHAAEQPDTVGVPPSPS